jgi:hypothetical protein
VQVELVDQSGSILPTPVKGFHNIGPLSTITVQGKAERNGKNVLIRATAFYVE